MKNTQKFIMVFVTCAHYDEANEIAQALVKGKLVAGVNILLHSESIFWWQKKIDRASEIVLIAKTIAAKMQELMVKVKKLHSYKVPEIIAWPIIDGSAEYLNWIADSVKTKPADKKDQ
ncbi:MAG: divalent-cation tolerance protein CutA [Elusimicrobia bacterium]|nr:divalent-cation tolerance protein CutA [Elusimicrobiota bacterium]